MNWEYTTIDDAAFNMSKVKTLGELGWELVCVDRGIAFFKRQIRENIFTAETKKAIDSYFGGDRD